MDTNDSINGAIQKLKPFWGAGRCEKIKLLYQLVDDEKKTRILKIVTLSLKKFLNDSLLDDFVLLPPSSREACFGRGELFVGDVCYGRNPDGSQRALYPLFLDLEDVNNHVVVTGLSGVGKTSAMINLVVGLGLRGQNVVVFDSGRQWRSLLSLSHPFVKDVRVFSIGRDIRPFCWNMLFSPPPGISLESWWSIASNKPLQKSLLAGQGVADYIETEAEALFSAYRKGILKLLPNLSDIKTGVQRQYAQARQLLWKQSTERVTKELTRQSVSEVFGSRKPINIAEEVLERPGITIIELDQEMPEHLRTLFKELFLIYTHLYFLHKGETTSLRSVFVMEEFSTLISKSQLERSIDSEIIRTIFREGRKFGLGLIAIAQEPSELPNYVLANAKVQLHFAVQTSRDIATATGSMFIPPNQTHYLDLIWRGEALAKVKGRVKNCLIKTPPPPPLKPISDNELKEIAKKWQEKN